MHQQAGQPSLPFPYQSTLCTHSQTPTSIDQNGPWTSQDFISHLTRKISEYERTILHLATTQTYHSVHPFRTLHGIICPDCKQEVVHTCHPQSLIVSPALRSALNEYEHKSSSRKHFTGPIAQGNQTAQSASFESSAFKFHLPSSSDVSSNSAVQSDYLSTSIMFNPAVLETHMIDPTARGYVVENWPVTAPSIDFSTSHIPASGSDPSSILASHLATHDANLRASRLGKRDLDETGFGCESVRKKARETLSEETNTNPHGEFQTLQTIAPAPGLGVPSFKDSFPTTSFASEAIVSLPSSSNIFASNSTNYYAPLQTIHTSVSPQAHFTGLTSQGNLFDEQVAGCLVPSLLESSVSHFRWPCPNNLIISQSGSSVHFQDKSSNDTSLPGLTDVNFPSFEVPPLPFTATSSAIEGITSPSIPASTAEESDAPSEPTSGADWSITHYGKAKIDVSGVSPLDVRLPIHCLTFSKDGKYLAVGLGDDGATNIYDVQTGYKTCTLKEFSYVKTSDETICAACFSPDGRYLATQASDYLIRIWEISKKHVRNVVRQESDQFALCIDFSPDGRLLATGSAEPVSLDIWNWRDGSRRAFCQDENLDGDIRFSPDGQYIAAGMFNGATIVLWNVRTGQRKLLRHETQALYFAFMPDGMGLVVGGRAGDVKCLDISFLGSGTQRGGTETIECDITKDLTFRKHNSPVGFVACSSCWVVCSARDGVMRISNAHSSELQIELYPRHGVEMWFTDFNPSTGRLAASCPEDTRVFLWRFREGLNN